MFCLFTIDFIYETVFFNFYNKHKFISNLSKKVVLEYDMLYLALLYVSLNKTV